MRKLATDQINMAGVLYTNTLTETADCVKKKRYNRDITWLIISVGRLAVRCVVKWSSYINTETSYKQLSRR